MLTDATARSISSVLRDIVQNVQDIVRAELRLAKTEIGEEAEKAKVAALVLGIGASCGFSAMFFVVERVDSAAAVVALQQAPAVVDEARFVIRKLFAERRFVECEAAWSRIFRTPSRLHMIRDASAVLHE